MADRYGTWKVTFESPKGKRTQMELVDTRSDVEQQARFFGPTYGKVVKVEAVK